MSAMSSMCMNHLPVRRPVPKADSDTALSSVGAHHSSRQDADEPERPTAIIAFATSDGHPDRAALAERVGHGLRGERASAGRASGVRLLIAGRWPGKRDALLNRVRRQLW